MFKRGQAALEFLTTYGWAFLVILVMIGALAYFGVLNPENFIPEGCQIAGEISCEAATLKTSTLDLRLRNNLPGDITLVSVNTSEAKSGNTADADASAFSITSGQATSVTDLDVSGLSLTAGKKIKLEFQVVYEKVSGFPQIATGSLTATVQP